MSQENDFYQWVVSLIAFGGWGYKSMTHGQRIRSLEEALNLRTSKLDDVVSKVSNMEGKLDEVAKGVERIQEWFMGKAK